MYEKHVLPKPCRLKTSESSTNQLSLEIQKLNLPKNDNGRREANQEASSSMNDGQNKIIRLNQFSSSSNSNTNLTLVKRKIDEPVKPAQKRQKITWP